MTETKIEELSYEEAASEIEEIIENLEDAERPLEESINLYARAQKLLKHCYSLLTNAELKVKQLSEDGELEEIE